MARMTFFSAFYFEVDWEFLVSLEFTDEAWLAGLATVDVEVCAWYALVSSLSSVSFT